MDKRDNKRNTHRMGRYGYAGASKLDARTRLMLDSIAGRKGGRLILIDVMTGRRPKVGVPFHLPTMVDIDGMTGEELGTREESYIVHEVIDHGTSAQIRIQTDWTSPYGEWLTVPVRKQGIRRYAPVPT